MSRVVVVWVVIWEWCGGGALLRALNVHVTSIKTPANGVLKGGGHEKGRKWVKMRTFVHIRARSFFSSPVMYWAWSRFSRPILLCISVQIAYKCVHLYTNVGGWGGEICRGGFVLRGIYRVYTSAHTCKYSAPPPPNYTPKITTPP